MVGAADYSWIPELHSVNVTVVNNTLEILRADNVDASSAVGGIEKAKDGK